MIIVQEHEVAFSTVKHGGDSIMLKINVHGCTPLNLTELELD